MKIKKITWQMRRDFTAIFECEHCGFEEKRDGYDDAFFHQNVIPSMKCDKCGKTAGDDYRPLAPKYNSDNCRKTSSEHELVWIDKEKGDQICPHCWGFMSYAFEAVDQPEPSLGYCDGCDELEAELHLMDGDWLCDKCKANENKTTAEALEDLKTSCTDHWEMMKARVFVTLFLVWVCFAIWGKYVS